MIYHKLSREIKSNGKRRDRPKKRRQSYNPKTAEYDHTEVSTTATKKEYSYVHDYQSLPRDVLQAIKPIYEDLSRDELLQRCVEGFTQNNNESFNQNTWKVMVLLTGYIVLTWKVSIGTYIATCVLNEGTYGLSALMNGLGISCGPNAHTYVTQEDNYRIKIANLRARQNTREGRMLRRQQKIVLLQRLQMRQKVHHVVPESMTRCNF